MERKRTRKKSGAEATLEQTKNGKRSSKHVHYKTETRKEGNGFERRKEEKESVLKDKEEKGILGRDGMLVAMTK